MNDPTRQGDAKRTAGAQWSEGVRAAQSAMPKWVRSRKMVRFQLVVFSVFILFEGVMAALALVDGDHGRARTFGAFTLMFVVLLAISIWEWRKLPLEPPDVKRRSRAAQE